MTGMLLRFFVVIAASLLLAIPFTTAPTSAQTLKLAADNHPTSIEVSARPLAGFDLRDRTRVQFGQLRFRSGLVLTSPYSRFGGLSGLRLDAGGEGFIAASDRGRWFTGRIVYRGKEMVGLTEVETAPMLGGDGRTLTSHRWYDTESMARNGNWIYVGIERVNRIVRFDFGRQGLRARAETVLAPADIRKLPYNSGLEALVTVPKGLPLAGTLVAISERGLDGDGNIKAYLIGGPSPGSFAVRRTGSYDVSDAALLPGGDLLLLERKFAWLGGIGIRIRRIAMASIVPGATVDGPSIFDADLGQEIDNFEGLDVHITAEGDTVLTLVSDDNFSAIQRTLLVQFTLIE
ncbi:MAG: esterase-like activity of phytase family protein [Rhizobiales bacterium]|nr:esterase-like activity of phytase family protein [Hyphomicrobiales bacterium]MBN8984971.1 esterase-like activity of phytase family protein [Hyphomicrobiales bacterium]